MRKFFSILMLAFVALNTAACFRIVDETEHCVETRYGKAVNPKLPSGPDFYLFTDATCFSTKEVEVTLTGLEVQTADSVPVTIDSLTFVYTLDPANIYDVVFKQKRTPEAAESQIMKASQDGAKSSFATLRVVNLFGQSRVGLNDHVEQGMQRQVGELARIKSVFLGGRIRLPQAVEEARVNTMTQVQNAAAQREKLKTDSIAAMNRVIQSEADRKIAENKAAVYERNQVLADLEVKKAQAAAWAEICKGVQTCIIGGNVVDKFMAGGVK
jgi:hypothetical protein